MAELTRLLLDHTNPLGAAILGGADDPTTVGVNGPITSLYGLTTNGGLYTKVGTGATQWAKLARAGWADVRDFGVTGNGTTDDTTGIQGACNQSKRVFFPDGAFNITSPIALTGGGHHITGATSSGTVIKALGCDGFTFAGANANFVHLENFQMVGYTAGGVIDAKTHVAIKSAGTNVANANYVRLSHFYLRGWAIGVDLQYTWYSTLFDIITINTLTAVRLFGQSVNNYIDCSTLPVNGGTASIDCVNDGSIFGEGLMITNSLLALGTYGLRTQDFLSIHIVGTTLDQIGDTAIIGTGLQNLKVAGSWLYAANCCIKFNPLFSSLDVKASITGSDLMTTAGAGTAVDFGSNNVGLSIMGGNMRCGTTGNCVVADGSSVAVDGVHLINPGANPSVQFNGGSDYKFGATNTGNTSVAYAGGIPTSYNGRIVPRRVGVTWSATPGIDVRKGNYFSLAATSALVSVMQAPTNMSTDAADGHFITISIQNASGGAMLGLTWAASYRLAGAWVNPANGFVRTITFAYNLSANAWYEVSRAAADVAA
jgi:hypothetical protein